MKYVIILFVVIFTFASCGSGKNTRESEQVTIIEGDTVHIKNDSLEYEIIIIEPGFNNWLVTQQPRGFYGQTFLEAKNRMFVAEYNRRVQNFLQFDPNIYQQEINYNFGIDYGYEVNYMLYNYFIYFQKKYRQRFPGARG